MFNIDVIRGARGQIRGATGKASVEVVGLNETIRKLVSLNTQAKWCLGWAMKYHMDNVIQVAQEEYVPIDTGKLRDSGNVKGPMFTTSTVEVVGSFGPTRNERGSLYTIPVHEIPPPPEKSVGGRSAHHQWGTWKYLQIPFLVGTAHMNEAIETEFWVLMSRISGVARF